MKGFFVTLLPLLLFLALVSEQVQACEKQCANTEASDNRHVASGQSCLTENPAATDCCVAVESAADKNHDCNGSCEGKCGGHCNCPCTHTGAVVEGEFALRLYQPEPDHSGFPYSTPFLSNVSLDIWLPPNIRA